MLGEEQLALEVNVEDSPTSLDEHDLYHIAKAFGDFVRQTGGAWIVVSLRAVFDREILGHITLLYWLTHGHGSP